MDDFKEDFNEEKILFQSTFKWTFLSAIIGTIVGLITTEFILLVQLASKYISIWKYYYFLLPLALYLSVLIVKKFCPDAKGHGTEKAIEAVHKNCGRIKLSVVPVKILSTLITAIFGGSVGLEGPSTQIGAALASFFGDKLNLKDIDMKRLVVCGISAGFASVLHTPIGAAIFATEVLYVGRISYISLLPCIVASFSSYYTGVMLGVKVPNYSILSVPMPSFSSLINIFIFSIVIGSLALLFIKFVSLVENLFKKLNISSPNKAILGGLMIILFTFIFNSTNYLGIGDNVIDSALSGNKLSWYSFIAKALNTAITLGSGGSGGILTPMLFIGSSFGNFWSFAFNGYTAFFSALGMVSFLGACCNTPIAAIIIALELFGHNVGIYAALACAISYLIAGHGSIYPTQMFIMSKSPSIKIKPNCEIGISKHINKTA